jgi:putative phosphoribosyl transferase
MTEARKEHQARRGDAARRAGKMMKMFLDRHEAGERLAEVLARFASEDAVILGLPRGGVPVAAQVASALHAPLDALVVRKLGCPWEPELGVGAIGEGGVRVVNAALVRRLGIPQEELDRVAAEEEREVARRARRYRGDRPPVAIEGRTVILVDDGLATGFTARAAIEVVRRLGARRVVVAVPVAPRETLEELRAVADEVVALETPDQFFGIGQFYLDFAQTSDEVVQALLESPATGRPRTDAPAGDPPTSTDVVVGPVRLPGILTGPAHPAGIVVFAHGSGSSRLSPRNLTVARALDRGGFATLLFDLLTAEEEQDRANVFDIELLGKRLIDATRWLRERSYVGHLPLAYFGASTGAAAALWAAAELRHDVAAVISRGGRPDLASRRLAEVLAPTLLIVGARDQAVLELNRQAAGQMRCHTRISVVPGATHLFEERGALERVADLALEWLQRFARSRASPIDRRAAETYGTQAGGDPACRSGG